MLSDSLARRARTPTENPDPLQARADARLGVRREAVQLDVRRERVRRVLQVRGGAGAAAVPAPVGGCSGVSRASQRRARRHFYQRCFS